MEKRYLKTETTTLKISVTSAKGLKKVKRLSKMDVFVAVKLSGDPKYSDQLEQRTQVARDCGTSPKWSNNDNVLNFSINQTLAQANRLVITFKIKCEQRGGGGDKDIGEVHVSVKELIDHLGNDKTGQRYVTYNIKKANGKPRGNISFNYSFGCGGPPAVTNGGGCSRYIAHDPVRPPALGMHPVHHPIGMHQVRPAVGTHSVRPPAVGTHHHVTNRPVLSQLLPSVGSLSYSHITSPPPIYPPVAQPEIPPQAIFPGLYPPHRVTPESPPTMYPTVSTPIFPGLSCPPEGYPTVAPPQTPPGLYPPSPTGFYRF